MSKIILAHIPKNTTKQFFGALAGATFAGITVLFHLNGAARNLYAALYVRSK